LLLPSTNRESGCICVAAAIALLARFWRAVDDEWAWAVLLLLALAALVDDRDRHVAISCICDKPLLFVVEPKVRCLRSGHARRHLPAPAAAIYLRGSGGQSTTNGHGPFCCCSRRVACLMMVMVMVFSHSSGKAREKLPPERTG
jgi:hypothetical protein